MSKKIFAQKTTFDGLSSSDYYFTIDSVRKQISPDSHNYSLLSFIDNFQSTDLSTNGIVFPGLKYLDDSVIIFERPPRYENIFITPELVDNINENSDLHTYRIPIPWQVYVIEYSSSPHSTYACDVRMFFRNSSLNTLDDEVYLPPLTNFYIDSSLCRPTYDSLEDVDRYPDTINAIINEAYDWIWNSGSNLDLTVTLAQYLRTSACNASFHHNSIMMKMHRRYSISYSTPSAFYASSSIVNEIFNSWSKIDLSEVCNLQWIYPFTPNAKDSFSSHINHRMTRIVDAYGVSNEESICCEDCQYYDEDGDLIEGECVEEGQCSCHQGYSSDTYEHAVTRCIQDGKYNTMYDIPMTLGYFYNSLINPGLRVNVFNSDLLFDSLLLSS